MKNILITGVNGFAGQAVLKRLKDMDVFVRGAIRGVSMHATHAPFRPNELVAVGDIGPDTDWSCALAGVDAVVHLAGKAHTVNGGKDQAREFYRVNTQGTERLCKMAASSGVRLFIYVSTVKVHGETSAFRPFSEKDIPAPVGDYATSKLRAEQCVHAVTAGSGMKAVILRPPMIYGPGVKGNMSRLIRLIDMGVPLPLSSIKNRRSLLNVSNFADLVARLIGRPISETNTFLVSDGQDLSTHDLVRLLAKALGKKARLFPCSPNTIRSVAGLLKRRDDAERVIGSLVIDSSLIRKELNWTPPYSVWSGLQDTAAWHTNQKRK